MVTFLCRFLYKFPIQIKIATLSIYEVMNGKVLTYDYMYHPHYGFSLLRTLTCSEHATAVQNVVNFAKCLCALVSYCNNPCMQCTTV